MLHSLGTEPPYFLPSGVLGIFGVRKYESQGGHPLSLDEECTVENIMTPIVRGDLVHEWLK